MPVLQPPVMDVNIAPFPGGQNFTTEEFLEWLEANTKIAVPSGFIVGYFQDNEPPPNSGLWIKLDGSVFVWDIPSASYVPRNSDTSPGEIKMFAFSAIDLAKYVPCDGSAIPRVAPYDHLYAKIGTLYGTGDGSTTFNVPDLRGRAPIGAGTGTGLSARVAGDKVGEETHLLTAVELPSGVFEGHPYSASATNPASVLVDAKNNPAITNDFSVDGNDQPHNNMQPSQVVAFAIRYA